MEKPRKRRIGCAIPGAVIGLVAACLLIPATTGDNYVWLVVAIGIIVFSVGLQLVMDADRK